MRRSSVLIITLTCLVLTSACGGTSDSPSGSASGNAASDAASPSVSDLSASASASPSRTPVTTTAWVINPDVDPSIATGVSIDIVFPATETDLDLISLTEEARKEAGLPEGTWLVATVRNDSDQALSIGTADVVTGDRQQVKLDSAAALLGAIYEIDPNNYGTVADLAGELADMQGTDIKPGTDATVALATDEAISGGVVSLYLTVDGVEIEALPPDQVTAPSAPAALEGDLPEDPSAEQVAAALGCETFKARTPKKQDVGPTPVANGMCRLDSILYEISVYESEAAVTAVLPLAEGIAQAFGMAFELGYRQRWTVTGEKEMMLGPAMKEAVLAAGGEITVVGDGEASP